MTEVQAAAARPKPSRSQPEFAKKLRYLQQSDPVDAKELTRRLEICFAEQEQNIERTLRPVRSSSDTSLDGSGPPSPKKKARPFTFHPDSLARSLDFHQRKESGSKPVPELSLKKAKRRSVPLLSQGSIKLDKSELQPDDKASRHNLPLPAHSAAARSSRILDAETQPKFGQNAAGGSKKPSEDRRLRISTASRLLTADAKAGAGRNDGAISPISVTYSHGSSSVPSSLPPSFRIPLPAAGESLMDSIQGAQSDPTANADALSLESNSTVTKQRNSASSSGYPSTTPSSQPPSSPPKTVTQLADKRKSWNMRSLVASRKSKEGAERGSSKPANPAVPGNGLANTRVISPHAEVARAAVTSASTKAERRKSALAEKTFASRSTPDLLSTSAAQIPLLVLPGDQKRSISAQHDVRDHENSKKDNKWKRFSLRRLNDEHDVSKADKDALKTLPTTEDLRSKQLAMRQKAITDAKKPKDEKAGVYASKEPNQPKDDLLEAQLQELQDQQVRERQRKEQLIEENRQRQREEERRQQEIAEAKRQHQLIEERRRQKLAEGMRLQEQRLNELEAQKKAETERLEAEREANEKAERELIQEQERQKLAKEKELQELHAQLQALQEEERQTKAQSQASQPKKHSRGPSAASMKPWAPPPRVSSSRTSISRTPFTPPQASRKPSLVGQIDLTTDRSSSPRYSLIPLSPATRADNMRSESRKNSVAEIPAEFRGNTSRNESRKNSNTELPKEIQRPPSPFSCPRPPPRIDSLPKKDSKPVINHSRPTSRGNSQSRPTSRGREEMTPRKVTYSNYERPVAQPLRSRTPSLRRHMPLIGEDGHSSSTLHRSRSSSTTLRPKSRAATPSIPEDVPEFDPTGLTPESKRLLASQRDQLLNHKAKSSGGTPTRSQFSSPPPFRRISRFYSTVPPQTAPHSKLELNNVEKIPGMTPESVVFLRQQEKLAAERFGWDLKTFTVAPTLRRNLTEDTSGFTADSQKERKYKKQNWWKVWRLL